MDVHAPEERAIAGSAIAGCFELVAMAHGETLAVVDGVTRLAYGQLLRASRSRARRVDGAMGEARGAVGVVLPNGAYFPVALLGCLAAGRPYVPLDPLFPAERNRQVLKEAGLSAVIVDKARYDLAFLPAGLPRIDIADALQDDSPASWAASPSRGPAVVLYTSGSTGRPKGICYDEQGVLERVQHAAAAKQITASDRIFLLSSPCTIAGIRVPLLALLNGATLYCADPNRVGIDGALEFLAAVRPTAGFAVPSLLRTLCSMTGAREAFSHARIIRTGGDVLLRADHQLWRSALPAACRVLITLTSTEMPAVFEWTVPAEWTDDGVRLPVGYARPGVDFQLVDDQGSAVQPGQAGELVVRSRALALGHWQGGRLEPGPFATDPDDPSVRILRTGDMVRIRPDGLAEMVGRKDRQIKIRGFRIQPGDVENAIRGCDGVADVAVIARRNEEEAVALVAYVVKSRPALAAGELKDALETRLPLHMRPAQIRFIDAIPQLPGFKNDFAALEKLDEEQRATLDVLVAEQFYIPPLNQMQRELVDIWQKLLGRDRIGIRDNFFELGGTSLMIAAFAADMNRILDVHVSPAQLIRHPTVEQLTAYIRAVNEPRSLARPSVIQLSEGESGPPIYLMNAGPDEFRLARLMGGRHPVFGIESPWPLEWRRAALRDQPSGLPSMEQLAARYADALCKHARLAPCVLAGHSLAGTIAFEVAHRYRAEGGSVALVMLFDSSAGLPPAFKAARCIWKQVWQPAPGAARQESFGARLKSSIRPLRWVLAQNAFLLRAHRRIWGESTLGPLTTLPDELGMPIEIGLLLRLGENAIRTQRPRRLDSRGVLFSASERDPKSEFFHAVDDCQGWRGLFAQGLEIIPVSGDHLSMIRDARHQPTLAEAIGRALAPVQGTAMPKAARASLGS
jgi:acyl-CoA synthetase (AMP-forming)/AMP-acid ligase II/thioesterase domain-containing protein